MMKTSERTRPGSPGEAFRGSPWPVTSSPTASDFAEAFLLAGLSLEDACHWTGKHRTTLSRMLAGKSRPCPACYHLFLILAGVLPWPGFTGWRAGGGKLYPPNDPIRGIAPDELARLPYWQALAATARAERRADGRPRFSLVRSPGPPAPPSRIPSAPSPDARPAGPTPIK